MPSDLKFPGRALQDETVVSQNVERHFVRQLAQLDAMTAVALKLLKANEAIVIPVALGKTHMIVLALYSKLLKTVPAIRVMASLSLVEDAQVLCRTLAETAVAIRYILQKRSAIRAEEYIAHKLMRTKHVMTKWGKVPGLKRRAKHITRLADAYKPTYDHLGEQRLKELRRWYYGNREMADVFKEVGLERMYHVVYLQFAGVQRVSDAERHVEFGEKGTVTVLLGSSDEGQMNVVLQTTSELLWLTISRLSRKFKMGYEADIANMKPEHRVYDALRAWRRRRRDKVKTV